MFEKVFINVKSGQRQRASHTYTLYIMIGCAYTICVVFCADDNNKKGAWMYLSLMSQYGLIAHDGWCNNTVY